MARFFLALSLLVIIALSGGMFFVAHKKSGTPFLRQAAKAETVTKIAPGDPPVQKCINMGGALEAPNEGDWGYRIRREDFRRLKREGFDSVRIPIKWSERTQTRDPYTIDENLFRRIDNVVRYALDADLKVIINVHHYDEINEDAEGELPRLYAIWDQIIAHYNGFPEGLIFEFLNEPHTQMTPKRVDDMNRTLLAKVRAVSADRWVILGGGQWGTLDGLLDTKPPYDPRAMVTFHYYEPFEFTHQGAPWAHKKIEMGQVWGSSADRRKLAQDLSKAAHWRDDVGMPMLLGEFGVYVKVPDAERAAWSAQVRKTAETVGFGWCYWDFATSLGIYDLETEQFRPGMVEALVGE